MSLTNHEPYFPPVLDSTMLSTMSCWKKFYRSYVCRYTASDSNVHLHAGGAYAKGLEVARRAYFEGTDADSAMALGLEALITAYGDYDAGESNKSLERMCGAYEFYFDKYPLDTDPAKIACIGGKPAVEWRFAIPLPFKHPTTGEPLVFAGRTDACVEFARGLYLLDDKTCSQLGSSWARQWDLRGQFVGYAWAARELGLKAAGTIVRGNCIYKKGYDTTEAIIAQPGWKIDQWKHTAFTKIEEALRRFEKNDWPFAFSEVCNEYGGCEFRDVCQIEDAQPWLDGQFELRTWDPLAP